MARIVFTLEDGTEIETELDSDVITVGRHPDSMVVLPSASVSSHHATLKVRGDIIHVQDLGSTNGTRLNGADVEEAKLSDGDQLMFGDIPAVLYLTNAAPAAAAVAVPDIVAPRPQVQAARRPGPPVRRPNVAARPQVQYKESTGCAGFFMLVIFLTLAFVIGLCLRHYNETQGFLPMDVLNKIKAQQEAKAAAGSGTDTAGPASSDVSTTPVLTSRPAPTKEEKKKKKKESAAPGEMNGDMKMN